MFIFTRPRRFGKSLNLSMLDAFFNLEYKGNNWFEGLKIDDRPEAEEHKNAYPAIFLSMKDFSCISFEQFLSDFQDLMRELYGRYDYLAKSEKPTELEPKTSESTPRSLLLNVIHGHRYKYRVIARWHISKPNSDTEHSINNC